MKKTNSVLYFNKFKRFPTARDKAGVEAMRDGFKKHGYSFKVVFGRPDRAEPFHEVVLTSGWNRHPAPSSYGESHLILDCGYLGDRTGDVLSLGWFGLNNQAHRQEPLENRGLPYFEKCKPWIEDADNNRVLLIGQVPTDKSLFGVTNRYKEWLFRMGRELQSHGYEVMFKAHPRVADMTVPGVTTYKGRLPNIHTRFNPRFALAYSSNALVELAIEGVYPVPVSPIAMTWDIKTGLDMEPNPAKRKKWLDYVASKQFSISEMRSGFAFDYLRHGVQQ